MAVGGVAVGGIDDNVGVQSAGGRRRLGVDDFRADRDRIEVRGCDRAEGAGLAGVLRAFLRQMQGSASRGRPCSCWGPPLGAGNATVLAKPAEANRLATIVSTTAVCAKRPGMSPEPGWLRRHRRAGISPSPTGSGAGRGKALSSRASMRSALSSPVTKSQPSRMGQCCGMTPERAFVVSPEPVACSSPLALSWIPCGQA